MFEVISYGGGELLSAVLNGVAMFFGASSYIHALKMAATLACIGILVSSAFSGRYPDLKWMFGIIMIYIFLFVPKVDVTITDTVERAPGGMPTYRVVGNVPVGLAFAASFTSQMKDFFTRNIETVFSLPNEVNYRSGGPLLAQGIIEAGLKTKAKSPNLNMSLGNFWKDCVFFDIALGFYSMNDLVKADDIASFLAGRTAQNRMYQHVHTNGNKTFEVCADSIATGALAVDMQEDVRESAQAIAFLNNLANDPADSARTNALLTTGAAAMPVALNYLTGMSLSATQMLTQTTLANSFQDGLVAFASAAEAQEVMQGYAAAKAESERSISFGVMGKIAGKMLPLLNIIAEALIYAVFPIIGLMCMFPGAHKVITGYIIALAWIALWAPLYAILHFFTMLAAHRWGMGAAQICDAVNTCTPHLNMYTMGSMKEAFAGIANISGYFATLVPMVSYMLVSRSGAMMAGTVGRFMDGYSQPVSHAATEAAGGNVSAGNVQIGNVSAFQQNTAPNNSSGHLRQDDGNFVHIQGQGGGVLEQRLGHTAISGAATRSVQSAAAESLSQAVSAKDAAASSLAEARLAKLAELASAQQGGSHDLRAGVSAGYQSNASESKAATALHSAAERWADTHLAGTEKSAFLRAMASISLGGNAGPLTAGAGVQAGGEAKASVSDSNAHVREFLTSTEAREALDHARQASIGVDGANVRTASTSESQGKTATDERLSKAETAYTAAVESMETAQRAYSTTHADGFQVSADQGLAIQRRLVEGLGGLDQARTALNDIAANVDSSLARAGMEIVSQYYREQAPQGGVDYDAARAEVITRGQERREDLREEADREVKADSTAFRAKVPNTGLANQAETQYENASTTATALHNGYSEQVDNQTRDNTLATLNGTLDLAANTPANLGDRPKEALRDLIDGDTKE